MQTVLFICTGNTCRSPMAEAAARFIADEAGPPLSEVFFASAGVSTSDGLPTTPEAVTALANRGITFENGRSTALTAEMIREASLVLGLTESHVAAARRLVEGDDDAMSRIQRLDPAGDIDDPIGMPQDMYDAVLDRLMTVIPTRLAVFAATERVEVQPMHVALGADHRGAEAAEKIQLIVEQLGHDVSKTGVCTLESCDYPDNAWVSAGMVSRGEADRAILICGSGIGVSIAANKLPGVRAALVADTFSAEMSRRHNDANVLCLSGDMTPIDEMKQIITIWLETDFEGGRHGRRVDKIAAIERGEDPTGIGADAASSSAAS